MNAIPYPEVEKRLNPKNLQRYYIVDCPEKFIQKHGFKSESSLRKCYTWWYYNVYLKNTTAKQASGEWELKNKDLFYSNIKDQVEKKSIGLKVKKNINTVEEVELPPVNNSIEVPDWMD